MRKLFFQIKKNDEKVNSFSVKKAALEILFVALQFKEVENLGHGLRRSVPPIQLQSLWCKGGGGVCQKSIREDPQSFKNPT